MNTTEPVRERAQQDSGWVILFAIGLLMTVSIAFQAVLNRPEVFAGDTGVSWADFAETYPSVAAQYALQQNSVFAGYLAVGLFALAVTYFAFRIRQRWAWFTLWILPGSMIPGIVGLAQSESDQRIFAVIFGAFLIITVIGLLLPIRKFFPGQG